MSVTDNTSTAFTVNSADTQEFTITMGQGFQPSIGWYTGTISAVSNSVYRQRVEMSLVQNAAASSPATPQKLQFDGHGEGTTMTLATGETEYHMDTWALPITGKVNFFYNKEGKPNTWVQYSSAEIQLTGKPDGGTFSYGTEDAKDQDFNDIVLSIKAD